MCRFFPVLVLALAAAPVRGQAIELDAVDSVSVSRTAPYAWQDNRIRVFRQPAVNLSIQGAYRFDLSSIPKETLVASVKLTVWIEHALGSPSNDPVVAVRHSTGVTWTRATATPAAIPLGTVVAKDVKDFSGRKKEITLDVTAHDFRKDIQAGALTLVVENVKTTAKSYVYFFGHKGSPTGPNAKLEIVPKICKGKLEEFGQGGVDSWNTVHTLTATGCPEPGGKVTVTAKVSTLLQGAILLWTGASREKWGAIALPLDLKPFGAPGNSIWVSLDVGPFPVPNPGGGGSVVVPIPSDPTLKGVTFFLQTMLHDPFGNTLQLVFSNGLEVGIAG